MAGWLPIGEGRHGWSIIKERERKKRSCRSIYLFNNADSVRCGGGGGDIVDQ